MSAPPSHTLPQRLADPEKRERRLEGGADILVCSRTSNPNLGILCPDTPRLAAVSRTGRRTALSIGLPLSAFREKDLYPRPPLLREEGESNEALRKHEKGRMEESVKTNAQDYLLSIMIPVYNESNTLGAVIERVRAVQVQEGVRKEIIVVDDGSTDGTDSILRNLDDAGIVVVRHPRNRGKGAAVRTALEHVNGDWALIQDADLEYAPEDVPELIAPLLRDPSIDAVFGSRFLGQIEGMKLPNFIANKLLTWFTNLLFLSRITDLCTGYKLYRTDALLQIPLVRDGFDLEHELTAKLLKNGCRIVDVPITYRGRDVSAGKKVRWTDFFLNIKTLLKYRFSRI